MAEAIRVLGAGGCGIVAAADLLRSIGADYAAADLMEIAEAIAKRCAIIELAHRAVPI